MDCVDVLVFVARTPWLLGYKIEDLIGQHPGIFKHPADFPYSEEGHKSTEEHVKEKCESRH